MRLAGAVVRWSCARRCCVWLVGRLARPGVPVLLRFRTSANPRFQCWRSWLPAASRGAFLFWSCVRVFPVASIIIRIFPKMSRGFAKIIRKKPKYFCASVFRGFWTQTSRGGSSGAARPGRAMIRRGRGIGGAASRAGYPSEYPKLQKAPSKNRGKNKKEKISEIS